MSETMKLKIENISRAAAICKVLAFAGALTSGLMLLSTAGASVSIVLSSVRGFDLHAVMTAAAIGLISCSAVCFAAAKVEQGCDR